MVRRGSKVWLTVPAVAAGLCAYAAVLAVLMPGHVTRLLTLGRDALPATGFKRRQAQ